MSLLKSLNFAAVPKHVSNDPIANRRRKLIVQLEQQLELVANPSYVVARQKWVAQENGSKALINVPKRVKRWWSIDAAGNCFFVVRYGSKMLALQEGKAAIVCTKDTLSNVIQTLIDAVAAGEIDTLIDAASAKNSAQLSAKQPAKISKRVS